MPTTMICEKCHLPIDNTKGGFITLSNGKKYHGEWVEEITNEAGELVLISHPACQP